MRVVEHFRLRTNGDLLWEQFPGKWYYVGVIKDKKVIFTWIKINNTRLWDVRIP